MSFCVKVAIFIVNVIAVLIVVVVIVIANVIESNNCTFFTSKLAQAGSALAGAEKTDWTQNAASAFNFHNLHQWSIGQSQKMNLLHWMKLTKSILGQPVGTKKCSCSLMRHMGGFDR